VWFYSTEAAKLVKFLIYQQYANYAAVSAQFQFISVSLTLSLSFSLSLFIFQILTCSLVVVMQMNYQQYLQHFQLLFKILCRGLTYLERERNSEKWVSCILYMINKFLY